MNNRTKLITYVVNKVGKQRLELNGDFYFGKIASGKTTLSVYRTLLNIMESTDNGTKNNGKILIGIVTPSLQQSKTMLNFINSIAIDNQLRSTMKGLELSIEVDNLTLVITSLSCDGDYPATYFDYVIVDNIPFCKEWTRLIAYMYSHSANIIVTGDAILDE